MKKILFFINTLEGGGAEKVIVDLLNTLDTTRYNIDLVTVSGGVHEKRLSDSIHYRKILKDNRLRKILSRIIYKLPLKLISFLFIKNKYDIEIAYLEGFPTRVIASRKNGAKKIAFLHCDVSVKPVLQNFYNNEKACLKEYEGFDKVCFVSKLVESGFEKTYGKLNNSVVIHNVLNVEEILKKSAERCEFDFKTEGLKIIAVGRLSKEKGYDRLIKIAADLEKNYDFQICILGEGPERAELERLIAELNVKSVKLLGYSENPYSYMSKSDIFICSSLYEGYSTVVTEAVVLGLPVITTDCAGMDEILDNGKYGIITENSEDGLTNGLIKVLKDDRYLKELKKASNAYSKAYSNEYAVMEYDELFKEILL